MILDRYPGFLSGTQLAEINHALQSVPRWIYRSIAPNNFWRYYIIDDLVRYDEADPNTWYGNQLPPLIDRLQAPWREPFAQISALAGDNFVLQRYTINGQTLGQDGVMHTDVSAALPGTYRSYLCYLNLEWSTEWGGATEILDAGSQCHLEYPEPGTLVVFDAQSLHRGLAPVRHDRLRVTMLWHGKHI